jgi:hypothetical protein
MSRPYIPQITAALAGRFPGEPPELLAHYAHLVMTTGVSTDQQDVHDAWAAYTATRQPEHEGLVPFDDLDPPAQERATRYAMAIRDLARRGLPEPGTDDPEPSANDEKGT